VPSAAVVATRKEIAHRAVVGGFFVRAYVTAVDFDFPRGSVRS
jgi:hypothetical protein